MHEENHGKYESRSFALGHIAINQSEKAKTKDPTTFTHGLRLTHRLPVPWVCKTSVYLHPGILHPWDLIFDDYAFSQKIK